MATADLTTAEGILRELWDVRANKAQLTPESVRERQKAAWRAARKILGLKGGVKSPGAGAESVDAED